MDTAEVILSVLVVVIIIVSLLSNVLVLICFLYNPEIRKQVPGLFNLNLTFCNLLLTVSNMPLTLVGLVSNAQPGGDGFCHIVGFLETFLSTNSMLSMAALSIDRWIAVVFPLRYHSKMRHKDAAFVLGYTWAHSMSFSTVAACLSWVGYHRLYASCTLSNPRASSRTQFVIFTVFFHSFTFLLSFIVLCVTYLKVLKVARFHCKRIDVITMQTLVLLVDIHPSVRQRCLEEQRRRRQRATRKISTFIGTFMLCFAPYVITRIVELFPAVPINPHWGIVSKCLAYSKAACDPFVYSLLRHQYKKTCTDIINRLLKRSSMNTSGRGHQTHGNSIPTAE
ncbi:G-protein coupled receptor 26-like [Hippoglossus hippoglossus]|uniref:G-protein coupled receptor 26-like n=1 Tax=Hippoglossus hippoglossus TaxID=8267 RepID=UPI00148DFF0E|nr:G-protein coupled receptor 26-like [Hippoglossus hippoglossus]XP_035000795.1 G-protein coupled receptor 26 [Hippoglossus stenolepis]